MRSSPAPSNGILPRLKAFYEFMTQNNLEALEIDESGLHLRMVRRRSAPATVPVPVILPSGNASTEAGRHAGPPAGTAAPLAAPAPAAPPAGTTIKSAMMGIFYRAASPSSPPFVKEGDAVKPGQVLCMIEAMKVFNEIKAEFPCAIVKVLVENGKPVKSGQDLFLVTRG